MKSDGVAALPGLPQLEASLPDLIRQASKHFAIPAVTTAAFQGATKKSKDAKEAKSKKGKEP